MFGLSKSNKKASYLGDIDILNALYKAYQDVIIVDTEDNTFEVRASRGKVATVLEEICDTEHTYEQVANIIVNEFIFIEDRNIILNYLKIKTLKEELSNSISSTIVARHVTDNSISYLRFEARRVDISSDKYILLTTKDATQEVHQDQMRQEQLREAFFTAERASLAKNQFLHNMSHDIRTPLNAIVGYTAVAAVRVNEPKVIESYLGKIEDASHHLIHIINEILDLGELDAGNIRITETVLTMHELVKQVTDTFSSQLKDKQLSFTLSSNDTENKLLVIDAFHVNRVLLNILGNAAKFNKVGGQINFNIDLSDGIDDNHKHYTFTIEDTGCGISKEFLPHVFDSFEREKTSTQSRVNGVGIGLSIVKNIVNALNGSIDIQSVEGEGTTVKVEFEFELAPEKKNVLIERVAATKEDPVVGKRILVVDDSKVNRDIATAMLENFKAIVENAPDGEDAVEMVKNSEVGYYDLILMDIQMPKLNGIEATKQIRALGRNEMPIVALTADVFEDTRVETQEAGMNDFLTKPVNIKALRAALEKHLGE